MLRGLKRIGPIRGIVAGDDVEVARDIARLWEWHFRLQAQYNRLNAAQGEDVFDIDQYGRGGCYYESMIVHGFSDPTAGRYFPMNEPSGSLIDESGKLRATRNGNPVQAMTPAPFPAEPEVGFQELDGTGDYYETSAETFLDFDANEKFTIMCWVRPATGFTQGTIASRVSGANGWYMRVNSSNKLEFSRRGGTAQITSKTALRDNVWSFVAVTYDGTRLTMYVDGAWDKQVSDSTSATSVASAALQIGAKAGVDTWKGGLCHLAIKKDIAFSKKTIEERLTFCSESSDQAPPPGGLIDNMVDIPADTCVAGAQLGTEHTDYANIKQIIDAGWRPHVKVFAAAPDGLLGVGVKLVLRKGDGTTESLGTTEQVLSFGYPLEFGRAMSVSSPSEEGTGEFYISFCSSSGFQPADSGDVSVFITWHKANSSGDVPSEPDPNNIPDGTADTVPIWDTLTGKWLPGKIRNANVDAAAAIAYSKLNLADSIVNADIAAAAAIAVSKLADGGANQIIRMVGGVPTWDDENAGVTDHGALTGLADDDHPQYRLESVGLVNADIDAAAAISETKLAAKTGAQAYHSVQQDVTTGTWTALALNSEAYDTGGLHDTATNNSRLTVPGAGLYLAIGTIVWQNIGGGSLRMVGCRLNGTTFKAKAGTTTPITDAVCFFVVPLQLSASDYVQMMAFQDTGGTIYVKGEDVEPGVSPRFSLIKLSQ